MSSRLTVFAALLLAPTAFAGGAEVTTTDVYDDYCTTSTDRRGNVTTICIFADFRVHEIVTPSGNTIQTWDGIRTMDRYVNGVLVAEGELFGKTISVSVDGDAQVDHRDTCYWLDAANLYQSVKLQLVDGHIVVQEVELVEDCN